MLRIANLSVRGAVLLLVGLSTFTAPRPTTAVLAAQIAAFAVAAVLLILWVPADRSAAARGRYGVLSPYALGVVTFMCSAASATPTGGLLILLAVTAVITAGSDTSLVAGWVVLGLGLLGAELAGLALGANASAIVEYPVVLLLAFVFGHNLRAHRVQAEQSAALLAQAEQLREEQSRVAALDERTRIAREIHDVLAHSLGALGLQIQVVRAVLADQQDVGRALALLDQAQRMASDGLGETRRAVYALRGEARPLPEGLEELCASHQRRHGTRVTFAIQGMTRALSPDAALAIMRTAQEALVNAAKHAPRQPVDMVLDYAGGDTRLMVSNRLDEAGQHGEGAELATVNGGYGLAGIRERLLLLDGTLRVGQSRRDWIVEAKVPQ